MASSFTARKSKSSATAQQFLPIDAVRDGIIVLKGNQGLRAVLMVSALNFALKSEEEQDALVYQYENFLNALDFPMQFLVQSRRLNIQPYLATLEARQKEEINDLLKVQIGEYIEFVKTFVDLSQIVTKTFYAVVPFQPSVVERRGGILAGIFGGGKKGAEVEDEFLKFKVQLLQRTDTVSLGLRRMGLRVAQLNTEELIELFYGLYNPTESQVVRESEKTS
ncbi:MAG: hypothetical protein HY473_01415 [Candidatus Sungbacteria bacterium]|uniref:TraC-like domain-containing protein n=1 Tax=Candidatus Sungiibacteriota bacterium TaxID=2750080 RepID=A0A932YYW5_9BACT|nr:hypothetical protein [Candidatus Sungbacteria bacterium]